MLESTTTATSSSSSTTKGILINRPNIKLTRSSDSGSSKIEFKKMYVYGYPNETVTIQSGSTSTNRVDAPLTLFLRSCEPGEYIGEEPTYLCTACPTGYKSNIINAISCTACAVGKITNTVKQSACQLCQDGEFGSSKHTFCSACPKGWKSQQPIVDSCQKCIKGKTNIQLKQIKCDICSAGKYANTFGDDNGCKHCIGSYIIDNSTNVTLHDMYPPLKNVMIVLLVLFNNIMEIMIEQLMEFSVKIVMQAGINLKINKQIVLTVKKANIKIILVIIHVYIVHRVIQQMVKRVLKIATNVK
jgi:hypothetical protein